MSTIESLLRAIRTLNPDKPRGLTILPGSGVNATSVGSILDSLLPLGLREIHLSGARWVEGDAVFRREGMGMGAGSTEEWKVWLTDEGMVRKVRDIVDARWERFVEKSVRH